ncbi:putative indole-3-acetic acid-amido synthetase GH3.1 [Acorus gramineus]|uniref:Indole-3-acetic acid-amido synthetase GH3.1 n=1 Tax=Acorus gramineus TaxID=55184 RepID=A0AAV9AHF6_ACOGR|nr:putative indole-3-acetic acid-amido synthetase GH3.1 [Acorus gramineus]
MLVMDVHVPRLDKGKGMHFLFVKSQARTPSGLIVQPVLTSYYKSKFFYDHPTAADPYNIYNSPIEVILYPDSYQSMWVEHVPTVPLRPCPPLLHPPHQRRLRPSFIRVIPFLENN